MFSPFEALMIACFGTAWPVSIWKSYTSRRNEGKSFVFLCVIFTGYVSGVFHKALFNPDGVSGSSSVLKEFVALDLVAVAEGVAADYRLDLLFGENVDVGAAAVGQVDAD